MSLTVWSQANKDNADKKYDKFAYIDAIKTYERIAAKGHRSIDLYQKLGNAYYFNAELEKANQWYSKLFSMKKTMEAEYYFRYSQTLKAIGKYGKADEMLHLFLQKNSEDARAKLFSENKNYLEIIKSNSGRFNIENVSFNSEYSDYGTTIFENKLFFASARDTGGIFKRKHQWTNQSFTQLYYVDIKEVGLFEKPEKFSKSINSKFNESSPVFTKDGKTVYFTRNNFNNGKKGKNQKKNTLLKIYKAVLKDGKWTDIKELPFTSDNYSTAHPALSPDEKTLFFASDMTGTFGQSDLFKVEIKEDGTFGKPENLGLKINTEGRETFPFISDENELYFASDGHLGLGGLDIFVSKIKNNLFSEVKNIGSPVNGQKDDFSFYINTKTRKGFFSSNRNQGKGYDDIYSFEETKLLDCQQLLDGIVLDAETGLFISEAKLTFFDISMNILQNSVADKEGKFSFDVDCGSMYYLKAESKDYIPNEKKVEIENISGKTKVEIELEKPIKKLTIGTDLAKIFEIKNIYFDLDKWNIREEAAIDLAKIVDVMKEYPNMKIDVRSHTDSRQTHQYNEKLSENRAKSTIAWIINEGISKERISGKGYGETKLLNNCADGVECSEEEHQQNRRSEFIITEL